MRGHRLSIFVGLVLAFTVPGASVSARVSDFPAYDEMLAQDFAAAPTFAFADAAEAAGDPDAAIAALEQLLIREPDNKDAHRRMARLYDSVGNDALAEVHRDLAGLPPRTQVWGRATIGVAHETNPTSSPTERTVPIFSAATNTFIPVPSGAERSDEVATVRLDLNLAHGLSETALLAADVSIEADAFSATEQLNSVTIRGAVGPWLSAPFVSEGASVRPFVTGGAGMLDSAPYYGQLGAGVMFNMPLDDDLSLFLLSDVSYTDYSATISPNFDADTLDNLQFRAGGQLSGRAGDIGYGLFAYGSYAFASADHESYAALRTGAVSSIAVPGAEETLGVPVLVRLGASLDWFAYADPSPTIDPTTSRRDLWAGGQGAVVFGLGDGLDLTLGADYTRRFSNVELFDSQNLRFSLELGLDF